MIAQPPSLVPPEGMFRVKRPISRWPVSTQTEWSVAKPESDYFQIFSRADGRIELRFGEEGDRVVLPSCPITFVGRGQMKLTIAWARKLVIIVLDGRVIASNDPLTKPTSELIVRLGN